MFISRISTAYGARLAAPPPGIVIPTDPTRAAAFAIQTDREADLALAEGRFAAAERLSHAAFEARCRAEGGPQ